MKRMLLASLMALLLSACGYHLVGQGSGQGAIPADVRTLSLIVQGATGPQLEKQLKQQLASDRYAMVEQHDVLDAKAHATLRVTILPLGFTPSAYDVAGVATQYRMTYSGTLSLDRKDGAIWRSGVIQRQGDIYVTGGPTTIQASRQRLQDDLREQWLQDAMGRLRSGF